MPRLVANAKKEKARAWLLLSEYSAKSVRTTTAFPPKRPAIAREAIMCQTLLLSPNMSVDAHAPTSETRSTGLRPKRSAAQPQGTTEDMSEI
jgi:hypothetical protein